MSENNQVSGRKEFEVGQRASMSKVFSLEDIKNFADISGDQNPVHIDKEFAGKTRFKGQIVHGMLVTGLISAVLGTKLPGPGGIYINQNISFTAPVRPGDNITAEVEVLKWRSDKRIITLSTKCTNQNGEIVINGEAVLLHEPPESF